MNMENVIRELRKMFSEFNIKYFDGELKEPMIVVQTHGQKRSTLGWCSVHQIWSGEKEDEKEYEITICAEYLDRTFYEICGTLQHEMVHLYNIYNNIKDVNANGKTHNIKFKEQAEKRGLHIEKADKIGWSVTTLTNEMRNFVDSLDIDKSVFSWKRTVVVAPKKTKNPSEKHKYVCPECNSRFESKKKINAMCEDCNIAFEEEGKV